MILTNPKLISLFAIVFLALAAFNTSWADTITTSKDVVEGRILDDESNYLIVETIAGEYVVIKKNLVQKIEKETLADFFYRRGQLDEERGNTSMALLDYLEALNVDPDHAKSKNRIESINEERRRQRWEKGLDSAQQHLEEQDYRSALNEYQEVLNMEPDERVAQQVVKQMSETHTRLAYKYYNHCYDQGAILELAKAEELNPESAEIYFVLARIHQTKRQYDQARLEYERALQLDPNHASARHHLNELIQETRGRFF